MGYSPWDHKESDMKWLSKPGLIVSLLLGLLFSGCPNIFLLPLLSQYLLCSLPLLNDRLLFISYTVPNAHLSFGGWQERRWSPQALFSTSESYVSLDNSTELKLPNKTWWILRPELVKSLSRVWLFATPWTVAHQAPPSMEFSRQEYWSGLPFPSPGQNWHPKNLNVGKQ